MLLLGAATPVPVLAADTSAGEVPGEREFNSCQKAPAGKPVLRLRFKPDTGVTELVSWLSSVSCTPFLIPSTAGKFLRLVDAGRARMTPLPYHGDHDPIPGDKRFITKLVRLEHLDATELVGSAPCLGALESHSRRLELIRRPAARFPSSEQNRTSFPLS